MPETQNMYRDERLGAPALSAALPVAVDRKATGTQQGSVETPRTGTNKEDGQSTIPVVQKIARCTSPRQEKVRGMMRALILYPNLAALFADPVVL